MYVCMYVRQAERSRSYSRARQKQQQQQQRQQDNKKAPKVLVQEHTHTKKNGRAVWTVGEWHLFLAILGLCLFILFFFEG